MRNVTRKNVELDEENVNWYYQTFPGGSLSGVLNQLLQNLRDCMEYTPEQYARIAAEQFKEQTRGR